MNLLNLRSFSEPHKLFSQGKILMMDRIGFDFQIQDMLKKICKGIGNRIGFISELWLFSDKYTGF